MYQAARGRLLVPGSPFQERFSAVQALAGSIWVAATGGLRPQPQPAMTRPHPDPSYGTKESGHFQGVVMKPGRPSAWVITATAFPVLAACSGGTSSGNAPAGGN